MITLEEFKGSLSQENPPAGFDGLLQALWHAGKGDWETAHRLVQDISGPDAAWVHAYLHREEGDLANAAYWYRRANRPVSQASLDEEWAQIATALLQLE